MPVAKPFEIAAACRSDEGIGGIVGVSDASVGDACAAGFVGAIGVFRAIFCLRSETCAIFAAVGAADLRKSPRLRIANVERLGVETRALRAFDGSRFFARAVFAAFETRLGRCGAGFRIADIEGLRIEANVLRTFVKIDFFASAVFAAFGTCFCRQLAGFGVACVERLRIEANALIAFDGGIADASAVFAAVLAINEPRPACLRVAFDERFAVGGANIGKTCRIDDVITAVIAAARNRPRADKRQRPNQQSRVFHRKNPHIQMYIVANEVICGRFLNKPKNKPVWQCRKKTVVNST